MICAGIRTQQYSQKADVQYMNRLRKIKWLSGVSVLLLAACQQGPPVISLPVGETEMISVQTKAPAKKAAGVCWAKDSTPALVETVTEKVLVSPAGRTTVASPDGAPTYQTVNKPAVYKTVTRPKIIKPRADFWFQVPCDDMMTRDFIGSLQRALKSRGLYRGALSGVMDAKTRKSVRWFQKRHGLNSAILSFDAARQLGLISYLQSLEK